jgi:hypothetical protein
MVGNISVNQSHDVKTDRHSKTCGEWLICCSWICALIVMPFVSVIIMAVSSFGTSSTVFDKKGLIGDILQLISYAAILYGIIRIIISDEKRHSFTHSQPGGSDDHHKHSTVAITFFFILGVGDSLFNMTRCGDQLILIINHNYPPQSDCPGNVAVSMTENLLKSFCQICILMFILYHLKHPIKSKYPATKIFRKCLVIFCLILWLQLLLQEVHHHQRKPDSCILPTSKGLAAFDTITPYLYPLGLEFRFASFIELLIMSEWFREDEENALSKVYNWLKKQISCRCCITESTTKTINNGLKTVLSFISSCFTKMHCPLGKPDNLLGSIFLPAGGIFLVSLSIVIVLFQEFNMDHDGGGHRVATISDNNSNLITLISEICEVTLVVIISLHSIYSLHKLCEKEDNPRKTTTNDVVNIKFKIDFAFLLIANICLLTYCGLTFVGSLNSRPTDRLAQHIRSLTLAASILPTVQTMLQMVVIWKARTYKGKLTDGVNQMWIILSFAIWVFDTFSAKAYNTNEIQIAVYRQSWDILAALFIPMAIFFRFHSCIMFANIKAEAYWDQHNNHSSA